MFDVKLWFCYFFGLICQRVFSIRNVSNSQRAETFFAMLIFFFVDVFFFYKQIVQLTHWFTKKNVYKEDNFFLQTVQHKLAEIKTEVCVGRAFVDQCLRIHNERGLDSATASMAKYWYLPMKCSFWVYFKNKLP